MILQPGLASDDLPTENSMGIQNKSTPHQPGSDDSANQSVLGEEDPGAAVDTMPWLAGDTPGADGTLNACGASDASPERDKLDRSKQLQKAISRWENEGGADGDHASKSAKSGEVQTEVDLTNAELVQLQVRVIALENLVIALLAGAADQTPDLARAMAAYISPRPGSTPHHLTIHAAAQMVHLVERSNLFRTKRNS
ncbi:hypothetical protein [Hydrogenophaga sp.]|uniref:hypothetical protein n=2 Tax=unclassified Hydrogenophaga TaxID=2610897 RepID=UPI00268119D2|nr:hypothetical protein [Burkholderiaceae bacterium]